MSYYDVLVIGAGPAGLAAAHAARAGGMQVGIVYMRGHHVNSALRPT